MTTRNKLDAISIYYALERAGMAGAFKSHEVEDMASGLAKAARALDRINLDRCNGISRWDNTHKAPASSSMSRRTIPRAATLRPISEEIPPCSSLK
jgi:hypothetical protein